MLTKYFLNLKNSKKERIEISKFYETLKNQRTIKILQTILKQFLEFPSASKKPFHITFPNKNICTGKILGKINQNN
jgi:hypothetical protein